MNTKTETITTRKTSVDGAITKTEIFTQINTRTVRLNGGAMRVNRKAPQRKGHTLYIEQKRSFDNPIDYDEWYNEIIAFGEYSTHNNSEYGKLVDRIVDRVITGDMDYMVLNYNRNGYKNVSEVIEDYLWVKPNKWQTGKVKKYLEMRYGTPMNNYYDDEDLVADLLTLFTPYHWETTAIHGCVQGEYADIVYPTELYEKQDIEEFEAFFFNKYMDYCATYNGEEWWYTYCDYVGEDEILNDIASGFGKDVKVVYTPYDWYKHWI